MEKLKFRINKTETSDELKARILVNTISNGKIRPFSLDIDLEFRVLRSLSFNRMLDYELTAIHEWELKNLWNKFILPWEIHKIVGHRNYTPISCPKDNYSYFEEIVLKYKPRLADIGDDYDGMTMHHAWDWNTSKIELKVTKVEPQGLERIKTFMSSAKV